MRQCADETERPQFGRRARLSQLRLLRGTQEPGWRALKIAAERESLNTPWCGSSLQEVSEAEPETEGWAGIWAGPGGGRDQTKEEGGD